MSAHGQPILKADPHLAEAVNQNISHLLYACTVRFVERSPLPGVDAVSKKNEQNFDY